MRIAIGSDHAGFGLKEELKAHLQQAGHTDIDHGPTAAVRCDYPDFARDVGQDVAKGGVEAGVLVCGSGIGMSIAANKVAGVRSAVVGDVEHALLAKQHNDVNVLCVGERFTAPARAANIIDAWLSAEHEGGRHSDRVAKITALEPRG